MTRFDEETVTVAFTHRDWSLLLDCASKRRRDLQDRADRLELEASDEPAVVDE